jgi:hypothetical protein
LKSHFGFKLHSDGHFEPKVVRQHYGFTTTALADPPAFRSATPTLPILELYYCVSGGGGPNSSLITCRSFGRFASLLPKALRNPSYRSPALARAAAWAVSDIDGVEVNQNRTKMPKASLAMPMLRSRR